jgi:hypothetical protein
MNKKDISLDKERKIWQSATQLILAGMIANNPPQDKKLYSGQPVWPSGIPQDERREGLESDSGECYVIKNGQWRKLP